MNSNKYCYSINELELLGVARSREYFKDYLYGKVFSIITDHRIVLSILKEHRSNKSYNSRLSRWVDRLLPYQFKIEHLPVAKMDLVNYISRNSYQPSKSFSKYYQDFLVATLSPIQADAKLFQQEKNFSAVQLNKFYLDIKTEMQTPNIP